MADTHKLHYIYKNVTTGRSYFCYENRQYRMTTEELNKYAVDQNLVFKGVDGITLKEIRDVCYEITLGTAADDTLDDTGVEDTANSEPVVFYANEEIGSIAYRAFYFVKGQSKAKNFGTGSTTARTASTGLSGSGSTTIDENTKSWSSFTDYSDSTFMSKYAIMYRDESTDLDLLPRKFNDLISYTIDAKNQNTALKYMLSFVVLAALFNMVLNYKDLNYAHVVVFILFCIYFATYERVSYSLLLLLKSEIERVKKTSSSVQVFVYLRLLLIALIMLFFPLIVFYIFDPEYLIPLSSSLTDNSVREGVSDFSNAANNAKDAVNDGLGDAMNMAQNTASELGESANSMRSGLENKYADIKKDVGDRIPDM